MYLYREKLTDLEIRSTQKGFSQWIPCGSIIRSLSESEPVTVKMTWSGQHYRLSKRLNDHIEQHGDLY